MDVVFVFDDECVLLLFALLGNDNSMQAIMKFLLLFCFICVVVGFTGEKSRICCKSGESAQRQSVSASYR